MMSRIRGKRGVVLPYVLVVGTVAMLLGATIFTAANASSALSKSGVSDRQAYLNAKSGIEYAKGVLAKDAKTGGLQDFFVVGHVDDLGQANFTVSTSVPASVADDIYVVCDVSGGSSEEGASGWGVKVVSTGRGNQASKNTEKIRQRLVFTANVAITQSLAAPLVETAKSGGGFDPTIMVNDRTTYTTADSLKSISPVPPSTDYSLLFQTPITGGNGTGLSAEKLYFAAGTGGKKDGTRAVSLGIASDAKVSFSADYIYVKDTLLAGQGAQLFLQSSDTTSTMVLFAPGSRITIAGKTWNLDNGAMYMVPTTPTGTDFLAGIKANTIMPLSTSNTDYQRAIRIFDVAALELSIPKGTFSDSFTFISGGTAGWVTPFASEPRLADGTPSDKTGKTVCLYATGGDGVGWASATTPNTAYKADVVRTIWNNSGPWSIPAPKSNETSFTITTDLLSLNIGSKNTSGTVKPVDSEPKSSFIVKSKTGAGNVIIYVAHSTDVVQAKGTVVNLTPGWHSVKSGTDLFRVSMFDLDTLLVSSDVLMIDGNQGTDTLKYVAGSTGKVSFEGNIAIPKNKAVEAQGDVFNFTGSEIRHNQNQGNQKQTLLLYTATRTGDVIVTFEKDITVEQISGALITFPAGTYRFTSGIDLLNIGTNMPKPYIPGYDFAFSDSVFR